MAEHADTLVVGDLIHTEGSEAVGKTVEGARDR
jgi:phosphoglycerol geranylgeranyltransferase